LLPFQKAHIFVILPNNSFFAHRQTNGRSLADLACTLSDFWRAVKGQGLIGAGNAPTRARTSAPAKLF
jgi:hypothetical protein